MTGRTPACEDAATISARLRELQAERMAAVAGCACPPDGEGGQTHRPGCVLEPRPAAMPSQLELAREAMRRARARLQRGQPAQLILPTDLQLTAQDIADLREIWRLQSGIQVSAAEHRIERADEIIAEGVAAKYARHRVLS